MFVLIVDGEPTTRATIAGLLEAAGVAVRVAAGENETERALSTGEVDVVVSAADPPRDALLDGARRQRPTPPVIAIGDARAAGPDLIAALRDLADDA